MAGLISREDIAREALVTLYHFSRVVSQITTVALAAYGVYCLFKDDDDTDVEDETPEREEPAPPSSG